MAPVAEDEPMNTLLNMYVHLIISQMHVASGVRASDWTFDAVPHLVFDH